MKKINIKTHSRTQMIDITPTVQEAVHQSGVKSGVCTIFIPHTTAGITINENADPDVVTDILKQINKIVPFEDDYRHLEGNSAGHIKASLFGFSQHVIVEDGKLVLGTWQGIYFCEFDGPRDRQIYIKIM
ncbi:MAG: secondary thiamine-phosphate synthase enzyme YjbQ [Clostridia bacterium]|nr:secondary thiamine-phosphate synthase enzyme YjbQ [Clostridia bacterium]